MVVFAIRTENREIVKGFMKDTNERLQEKTLAKNPYLGKTIRLRNYDNKAPDYYLIDMTPLYPPFYLGGLFAVMIYFIFPRKFLIVGGLIVFALGVFWSKYFMFVMLRLGLKKAGYVGPVKLIRDNNILNYLMYEVI